MPVQEPILEQPKQIIEIVNPEDRMFKSWASVEIRDREGDLLPMSEFRKIFPTIMKRGGALMDRHTNKQIGKILVPEFKEKITKEGPKPGLMLTAIVYKDYKLDDMVWEGVQKGAYKGLSFGGMNNKIDAKFEKGGLTKVLTDLEGFEFSLVPGMGNQEATMTEVNFLAKGLKKDVHKEIEKRLDIIEKELNIKEEINKPFAGFENFDACKKSQMDDGKSEESANKICGFLQTKTEEVKKQDDPARICGDIWFNGTDEERGAFGSTEGRSREDRPPKEWFDSCKIKIGGSLKKEEDENKKECPTDDKEVNKSQTNKINTLLNRDNKNTNYIKNNDLNKSMEVNKQDEINETPEVQNPMEVIAQKLDQILQAVSTDKQTPELVKTEDKDEDKKPKEDVEKQEDKDEKENDKKDKDVEKEEGVDENENNAPADGTKVKLPQSVEEKVEEESPASGAEGDKVNFVEKEVKNLKKQIDELPNQIMKQLTNKAASTPMPAVSINKSEGIKVPKNLQDVTKLMEKIGRR